MSIDQYWDSTAYEIFVYRRAYEKKLKDQYRLHAWQIAHILNMFNNGTPIQPSELMGGKKPPKILGPDLFTSPEIYLHYLASAQALAQEPESGDDSDDEG